MPDVSRLSIVRHYLRKQHDSPRKRKDAWHVRRFCQEDWVLHIRVYRCTRQRYEIALFLAEDHWKWVKDAGVMAGLVFALSEAYHQLGRMEVHFVGHELVVPPSIRRVADNLGVVLKHRAKITDGEGQALYARLTGLSPATVETLTQRGIPLARASFVVQRGLWSREQVEFLAREAHAPERLFDGGIAPEFRLSYQHDLLVMRVALLAERMATLLQNLLRSDSPPIHSEWLSSTWQKYAIDRDLRVPVLGDRPIAAPQGQELTVALAPRDSDGYGRYAGTDVQQLAVSGGPAVLAVTYDFHWVPKQVQARILELSHTRDVGVVAVVDTLAELDSEITRRLAQAVSTKRALPERPD